MDNAVGPYKAYETYIHAALLAIHANSQEEGFRQKDFKFYIELLSNWVETSFSGPGIEIQNTQVKRVLEGLVDEGLLIKSSTQKRPFYKIRPIGLLEITSRLVKADLGKKKETFLFLYHFVTLYAEKMKSLITSQENFLPASFELELKHLLNPKVIVDAQLARIRLEIDKLELRSAEGIEMASLAQSEIKKGRSIGEVVALVEKKYPYQLNNQKSMAHLYQTLSPDIQLFEITQAPKQRALTLWNPLIQQLKSYEKLLMSLK